MRRNSLARQRHWFAVVLFGFLALAGAWYWSPGLPVLFGPSASAEEIAAGRELFEHQWEPNDPLARGDGLGPVFNAKSCVACHFQGGVGGGGELAHNAVNYEILPRPNDPTLLVGTVHNFSVSPAHKESSVALRRAFPVIKGRVIPPAPSNPDMSNCGPVGPTRIPDFDPVRTESVQTTALFGVGWIDLISEKAILKNARTRSVDGMMAEISSDFGQIPVGRVRTLPDGRVGKFGWRGQFATLEEFVATACANEIGLGTPAVGQAKPLTARSTPDIEPDLDRDQFQKLMAFVKTLPKPIEATPADPAAAERGKELFESIGCAVCHVPEMGGVNGVYSDFLLYTLEDPHPTGGPGGGYGIPDAPPRTPPRPDDLPKPEEWKTPPLWGVADSAPYFHDGHAPNLQAAILRHRGDAKSVTERFKGLPPEDQAALVAFLQTLKAPLDAPVVRDRSITRLAKK